MLEKHTLKVGTVFKSNLVVYFGISGSVTGELFSCSTRNNLFYSRFACDVPSHLLVSRWKSVHYQAPP